MIVPTPRLDIDLGKIEHNSRTITRLCGSRGIEVTGVTKCVCGNPEIASAMLRGGAGSIGESRLRNIQRLRAAGIEAPIMLLRLPPLSRVEQVIGSATWSLNSEEGVLRALSLAARTRRTIHQVILMVDLGDLREGVWPDELPALARSAAGLEGIRITGVGTNLACMSGVLPTRRNMERLASLAEAVETECRLSLRWISGINSSGLPLLAAGEMPARINHARIGEAILLGRETTARRPWPGTFQDAFTLHGEILELKRKPSAPRGLRGEDAFGHHPSFAERGEILRALVNLGREDVETEGLTPLLPGCRILGASSGYLALDVTESEIPLRLGDTLAFGLNYGALLAAMASEHVRKSLV